MRLGAKHFVSDHELYGSSVPKSYVDKRIKTGLAHSLAEAIIEKDIERVTMLREKAEDFLHPYPGTEYIVECYVLTPEQHKEYEELKMFRSQMAQFVGSETIR
jgi:hypothetical protein